MAVKIPSGLLKKEEELKEGAKNICSINKDNIFQIYSIINV